MSGSTAIMALCAQEVTIKVSARAALVDASRQASPLTLRKLVPGAIVSLDGVIDRSKPESPTFVATKVTLHSLPAGTLLWSDEFTGPCGAGPDPKKWRVDTGGNGFGNEELEYYTARKRNMALDGQGHLAISALHETHSGGGYTRNYTSGKIDGQRKYSTTYGSIQASIELPAGRGLWPAFWALGVDIDKVGWPKSGEIDMMENLGQRPLTAYGSIHGPSTLKPYRFGLTTSVLAETSLSQGFHVYGVNRSRNLVQMTLDGVPYATYRPSSLSRGRHWVFNRPFFLILDLAVGGKWPGAPNATTQFPATMLVDWVRVYAWSPPH
jgi:beta-glucanase (GH16 family)